MYDLSICAILKDEADYLWDWLIFHINQGVKHFYLYDNNEEGDEAHRKVLTKGWEPLITWVTWPGVKKQNEAYNHCLKNFGSETNWLAVIDVDEYLYSPLGYEVSTVLDLYFKQESAVAVHWILRGSKGGEDYVEDTDVIFRFKYRALVPDKHIKTILKPSTTVSTGPNPHSFRFYPGCYCVNERHEQLPEEYALTDGGTTNILRIDHYHCKTKEEYMRRKRNPDANSGVVHTPERLEIMFDAHDCNDILDTLILKF